MPLMPHIKELRDDMRKKEWHIAIYPFEYIGYQYFVLFEDSKAIGYDDSLVIAVLTFIDKADETRQLQVTANQQGFNVISGGNMLDYLHVTPGGNYRDYYANVLCPAFNLATPNEFVVPSGKREKTLVVKKLCERDGENPDALYCYDVRSTGEKADGTPKTRTIFNSNKAELLRPKLYDRFKREPRLSFFFSDDPAMDRDDSEIYEVMLRRKTL